MFSDEKKLTTAWWGELKVAFGYTWIVSPKQSREFGEPTANIVVTILTKRHRGLTFDPQLTFISTPLFKNLFWPPDPSWWSNRAHVCKVLYERATACKTTISPEGRDANNQEAQGSSSNHQQRRRLCHLHSLFCRNDSSVAKHRFHISSSCSFQILFVTKHACG